MNDFGWLKFLTLEELRNAFALAPVLGTVLGKRLQSGIFEALVSQNKGQGSGAGSGLALSVNVAGNAAGGGGSYSTANSTTWTDITGTTFTFAVPQVSLFLYLVFATVHISGGSGKGFVRGSIVGFDNTASPFFAGANPTNGTMFYFPFSQGPLQPGSYTAKMQAATDSGTTIAMDQYFHMIMLFGQ